MPDWMPYLKVEVIFLEVLFLLGEDQGEFLEF
jgi:hypothetical protein